MRPDPGNRLLEHSWAQCEHLRSISRSQCVEVAGNVGPIVIEQIREVLALLLDIR